jgi:hypothetical protein
MSLEEEIADIATAIACTLYLLSKMGPIAKDQMKLLAFIVLSSTLLMAEAIEEARRKQEDRACRIMITTGAVFQEYYNNSNRKRYRVHPSEFEDVMHLGKKRRECKHNHERAVECVRQDWIGTDCIFSDRQFEQTFRLTNGAVERLIQACGNN